MPSTLPAPVSTEAQEEGWDPNDGLGVTRTEFLQWEHVSVCEESGNWHADGSTYSGIGFLNTTWLAYGGGAYAPRAGLATPDQQIVIGMRVTGGWVPDQGHCAAW